MRVLTYVLRFEGWAEPASEDGLRLRVEATAPPVRIQPAREGPGVRFEPAEGAGARFRAEVRTTSDGVFQEQGTIDLGSGAVLRFETLGEGRIGPAARPGLRHGVVVWQVTGGEGELAEAQGLLTSNFFLAEDGALLDHQLGVLEIP